MTEFHSKLEKVIAAEELRFNSTPSFGQYKPFLKQAMQHPAKMNTKLLRFLIEQFSKEGDTILDPMCGSGSTGVVAAMHGRNTVQIDIEERFIKWAEEAKAKVERQAVLSKKGQIRNVCGDARRLGEVLKEVDVVLTSPPYAETISQKAGGKTTLLDVGISTKTARGYDVIVTSPPYGEAQDGRGIAKEGYRGRKHSPTDLVGNRSYMPDKFQNPRNISNLSEKSYRASMLKVYMEMSKVLKPKGFCIIVIKPFIRNKRVVDLPYQTSLLLEAVGLKLVKLYKLRLKNPSFWRALYRKKHLNVPEIKHEYILVTQK